MNTLVSLYAAHPSSNLSSELMTIVESYATISTKIQHTSNPSGTFDDLSSLGEPKFNIDGSAYTENWGRPQRDGPPLRAITLMAYLKAFNETHPTLWSSVGGADRFADLYFARMPANSTIKADLEYVAHFWQQSGFDLWEEVDGMHFFTAIVQLRALREGSTLATAFGDLGAARFYHEQADTLEETLLPKFWDEKKGHLVETLDSSRSGLDCGLLLGSLHGTPATCTTSPSDASQCSYAPYSDEILVSLLALVQDQRARFPINTAPPSEDADAAVDELQGVGVGRYPEDGYDGYETIPGTGNPWFLCTSSVAEVLYRTHTHLRTTGSLAVTPRGLPFWRALVPAITGPAVFHEGSAEFAQALRRLGDVGDAFLAVVRKHADAEGAFSEQFDRVTGFMRGAENLTWSYGAFLEAVRARKAVL
jgi:glucoamylase